MLRTLDLRRGERLPPPAPPALDAAVVEDARAICARVRDRGDAALVSLTRELDGADVDGRIALSSEERAVTGRVPPGVRSAIDAMAGRLRDLHGRQLPAPWRDTRDEVTFGEVVRPLDSVGCYVPGGRAAYPSTALMTAIPARVAGVPRVVLCTPPADDGTVPDAVLYAAEVAGLDEVYRVGGAQAVAALAYGTESIARVDTIVGPGNAWVTAAKREVAGIVGIDGLAGPTELVVVADDSARPEVLAADLVAQAEHDPQARTTLVSLDPGLPDRVNEALGREVNASSRREIVERALEHAVAAVAASEEAAAAVVDEVAPEHLQVVTRDPEGFLARVRSYGAAFLGPHTPVPFGDYGVGSNHVLPTGRTARFASGLRAADFVTVSSVVHASPGAVDGVGAEVEELARTEGLPGHARAVEVRR